MKYIQKARTNLWTMLFLSSWTTSVFPCKCNAVGEHKNNKRLLTTGQTKHPLPSFSSCIVKHQYMYIILSCFGQKVNKNAINLPVWYFGVRELSQCRWFFGGCGLPCRVFRRRGCWRISQAHSPRVHLRSRVPCCSTPPVLPPQKRRFRWFHCRLRRLSYDILGVQPHISFRGCFQRETVVLTVVSAHEDRETDVRFKLARRYLLLLLLLAFWLPQISLFAQRLAYLAELALSTSAVDKVKHGF